MNRRFPMGPMLVLAVVNLVDQADMAILRAVLPILEDEWRLSDFELGLLGFAFVFINTIATIPAGWVADRYRRTRVIGFTLMSWSGLIALSATAVNYLNLLFARAVMGIGQAIDDPASTSLLGDYYPATRRARAFSMQQMSVFMGSGIGLALGGFVAAEWGWRWAFAIIGMPGSLAAFLVFRLREPRRGESDLPDGHPLLNAVDTEPVRERLPVRQLFRQMRRELVAEMRMILGIRTMRYILVGVSALLFTVSGIGYWLAVYHDRYSGMSLTEATSFTAIVLGIGGTLGTFLGGAVADRVYRRGPSGRIVQVVYSTIGCSVLFMVSFAVQSVPLRLGLQFVGILSAAGAIPALRAAMLDVIPAESRGIGSSAFALASAVLGTALAPPVVGQLSDLFSLVGAFYIVFPPVILGLLFLLRARNTIIHDAQQIFDAIAARVAEAAESEEPAGA